MEKMNCGSCGQERERGDICCLPQAYNQGALHYDCTHSPEGLSPELLSEYERGRREEALKPHESVTVIGV